MKWKKTKHSTTQVVVGGSEEKKPAKPKWINKPAPNHKKLFMVVGILCVVLAVAGLSYVLAVTVFQKKKAPSVYLTPCTKGPGEELATKAAGQLAPADYQKLKVTTEEIMKVQNYEKDVNCVYPVAQYYLYVRDETNAVKYAEMFKATYKTQGKLSDTYNTRPATPEEIQTQLDALKKSKENFNKNKIGF